jgi:guanyl-specific ribonuclease Sa
MPRTGTLVVALVVVAALGAVALTVLLDRSAAPSRQLDSALTPADPGTRDPDGTLARAREIRDAIARRDGQPPAGYVGGRTFENRERRLPPGRYREYDLHPRGAGRDRGPERLVVERDTGRAYLTRDHYRTFIPLD